MITKRNTKDQPRKQVTLFPRASTDTLFPHPLHRESCGLFIVVALLLEPTAVKAARTLPILAGGQNKAVPQFITIHVDALRHPRSGNRRLWLPRRTLHHCTVDSWLQSPDHCPVPH